MGHGRGTETGFIGEDAAGHAMRMAIITEAPTKPPWAAVGVKASETTHQNTEGTRWMFMKMMTRHMMI